AGPAPLAGPARPGWPAPGHDPAPARPVWAGEDEVAYRSRIFHNLRGVLTFGSPLEKFAALWPFRVALALEPAFRDGTEWINVYDPMDPVSGVLRSFDRGGAHCCPPPPQRQRGTDTRRGPRLVHARQRAAPAAQPARLGLVAARRRAARGRRRLALPAPPRTHRPLRGAAELRDAPGLPERLRQPRARDTRRG